MDFRFAVRCCSSRLHSDCAVTNELNEGRLGVVSDRVSEAAETVRFSFLLVGELTETGAGEANGRSLYSGCASGDRRSVLWLCEWLFVMNVMS